MVINNNKINIKFIKNIALNLFNKIKKENIINNNNKAVRSPDNTINIVAINKIRYNDKIKLVSFISIQSKLNINNGNSLIIKLPIIYSSPKKLLILEE